MECLDCSHELTENPAGPENPFDAYYTKLGLGPYCEKCYERWQEIDDKLNSENEELFDNPEEQS